MLSYMPKLKLDKAGEAGAPPPAAAFPPPPAAPPVAPLAPPPAKDSPPAEAPGSKVDDLGYAPHEPQPGDKDYVAPAKGKEKPPEPAPPPEPVKVEKPATGYGTKPPENPPAAPPPQTPEPVADEFDPALEGLAKEEAGRIKEFAKKNTLTVAQVKAFADVRKIELKNDQAALAKAQEDAKNQTLRIRASWDKELRDDPDFGRDNLEKNLGNAERVLEDFMPQTKKILTERGGMLPPYVMRDLAKMAEKLYSGNEKLVQGEASVPPPPAKTPTDEALEFYQ